MNQYIACAPLLLDKVVSLVKILGDVFVEGVLHIEEEVLYVRGEIEGITSDREYCLYLVCF